MPWSSTSITGLRAFPGKGRPVFPKESALVLFIGAAAVGDTVVDTQLSHCRCGLCMGPRQPMDHVDVVRAFLQK